MAEWQEEIRSAIKDKTSLENFFNHKFPETKQPIFIPLNIAKQVANQGINSPLGKQFLPSVEEGEEKGLVDPIGDFKPGPFPYFIHRYENRALFFPTTVCPIQCRYCFRKNSLHDEELNFNTSFSKIRDYLLQHPEINEIIFSGGDPLILNEKKLEECFNFFADFKSIKFIRFHTRMPIVIPSRITKEFISLLKEKSSRFKTTIVVHLNHPHEICEEVEKALTILKEFNILSQSVLLKDVNNNLELLVSLFEKLNDLGVRPYYLHHPDQVRGAMHFMISEDEGLKLYQNLRRKLSGWMLPQYIIDSPEASGKRLMSNNFNLLDNIPPLNY